MVQVVRRQRSVIGERPNPTQVTWPGRMNSAERQTAYKNLIAEHASKGNAFMLFQTIGGFGTSFFPPRLMPELLTGIWDRVGREQVCIAEP